MCEVLEHEHGLKSDLNQDEQLNFVKALMTTLIAVGALQTAAVVSGFLAKPSKLCSRLDQ